MDANVENREEGSATGQADATVPKRRAAVYLGCVMLGYIAVYLCRKNFSVATPLIREEFGVTKKQIGEVASWSTGAYAVGKIVFGPVIDRFGGRIIFMLALGGVALFGGLGALSTSLPMLVVIYSANRFFGAAGWGSMVKQVPQWFSSDKLAMPMAWLSLSFVFGGTLAVAIAGYVSELSNKNWRVIMGLPAIVPILLIVLCAIILPKSKPVQAGASAASSPSAGWSWERLRAVFVIPQFWVVCALSMIMNITRETFGNWAPDFFKTEGGQSLKNAALLSTPFDLAGGLGILFLGWVLDRVTTRTRNRLLAAILILLSVLIYGLPAVVHERPWLGAIFIGAIGFLSYGPYSLLAGVFSVEIKGKESVGTVAGFVDATGYLGAILAGSAFGEILDKAGYQHGFQILAWVTITAAILCLFLKGNPYKTVTSNV